MLNLSLSFSFFCFTVLLSEVELLIGLGSLIEPLFFLGEGSSREVEETLSLSGYWSCKCVHLILLFLTLNIYFFFVFFLFLYPFALEEIFFWPAQHRNILISNSIICLYKRFFPQSCLVVVQFLLRKCDLIEAKDPHTKQ